MQKLNCSNFNLGDKMCFFLVTISTTTQAFQKSDWCTQILWTILWFQDHNSRYSKDLIENSLSFLKGIDENKRHVELETLSKYPCRLGAVERSFQQPLQNACRNLSKEGLKMKFDPMLTENTKNVQVAPTTGIGKAIEVVNCAMKKVNHASYRGEVFPKAEKGKLFVSKS